MTRRGEDKLTIFVDALVATGARELVRTLEVDESLAREVMRTVAHEICSQFQRTYIYVPVDLQYQLSQRDREIWDKYGSDSATARKFSPSRMAELAAEYKLTTVQMYCILRLMRARARAEEAREFAERQGRLPGIEDETQREAA
jgi:Mor family transcriptional regulator